MPAAPQPPSREEILDAAAALTEAGARPADEDVCGWPDPDTGRPAALAGLDGGELEALLADVPPAPAPPAWPAGYQCPDGPGG